MLARTLLHGQFVISRFALVSSYFADSPFRLLFTSGLNYFLPDYLPIECQNFVNPKQKTQRLSVFTSFICMGEEKLLYLRTQFTSFAHAH